LIWLVVPVRLSVLALAEMVAPEMPLAESEADGLAAVMVRLRVPLAGSVMVMPPGGRLCKDEIELPERTVMVAGAAMSMRLGTGKG
jgi:hypothetical protein